MAKDLNLTAKWINDATLRIAWNDVKSNDQKQAMQWVLSLVWLAFFLLSIFTVLNDGGFALFGLVCIAFIAMMVWYFGSTTVPNHVDFSIQSVTFQDRNYPTASVTRFDYGVKSQLTGIMPQKDGNGNSMSDPSMIRMWIDDSAPVTISESKWSFEVCH